MSSGGRGGRQNRWYVAMVTGVGVVRILSVSTQVEEDEPLNYDITTSLNIFQRIYMQHDVNIMLYLKRVTNWRR